MTQHVITLESLECWLLLHNEPAAVEQVICKYQIDDSPESKHEARTLMQQALKREDLTDISAIFYLTGDQSRRAAENAIKSVARGLEDRMISVISTASDSITVTLPMSFPLPLEEVAASVVHETLGIAIPVDVVAEDDDDFNPGALHSCCLLRTFAALDRERERDAASYYYDA